MVDDKWGNLLYDVEPGISFVQVWHRRRNHKISGGANDIMSQNIILNYLSCHSIINEYVNNYTSSLYKIVRLRYIIWGGQSHNK